MRQPTNSRFSTFHADPTFRSSRRIRQVLVAPAGTAAFCVGLWLSGAVLGGRVRPRTGALCGAAALAAAVAVLV